MNNILETRLTQRGKFQNCQVEKFLTLLKSEYPKILEIGCGKGFFSYLVAKNSTVGSVTGCDVYPDFQIKEISSVVPRVEYSAIAGDTLPFKDNYFNLVFSMDVIEHLENDRKSITEHIRVTKPGGQIIIGTPIYFKLMNLLPFILGRIEFPRSIGWDTYGDSIHIREYKKSDLLRLLAENKSQIEPGSTKIIPCWFGVMALNLGFARLPKILEPFCQFWLVSFTKKKNKRHG